MNTARLILALAGCLGGGNGCPKDSCSDGQHASGEPSDADGDGYPIASDCDDADALSHPGAVDDVGDGIDENCDGVDGADADGDGDASLHSGGDDCEDDDPTLNTLDADDDGFSTCLADCDDLDASEKPGGIEVCDGADNDCDGVPDVAANGAVACERVERFVSADAADVLIVVENSGADDQIEPELAAAAADLLTPLVGTGSVHVGVLTTDVNEGWGELQGVDGELYIDDSFPLPDAVDFLGQAVEVPAGGPGQARAAVWESYSALGDSYNTGFFRYDSHLSILFFGMYDDQPVGIISLEDFEFWLDFERPVANLLSVNAIDTPAAGCAGANWFFWVPLPGVWYDALVDDYSGTSWSICDLDYHAEMAAVAAQVRPTAGVFALSDAVVPGSASVSVTEPDGSVVVPVEGVDWELDGTANAVTFTGGGYWPVPGSDVEITYLATP